MVLSRRNFGGGAVLRLTVTYLRCSETHLLVQFWYTHALLIDETAGSQCVWRISGTGRSAVISNSLAT